MARRLATLVAAVAVALTASVAPAGAITNGTVDTDNDYPYVGMVTDFAFLCSGAAISPTIYVTAAHCFDDPVNPTHDPVPVAVTFSVDALTALFVTGDFVTGTWHPDPQWCTACGPGLPGFDTHDVAVVVLDEPVDLPRYANLPDEGLADGLANHAAVTNVGYGVNDFNRGGGPPGAVFDGLRRIAPAEVVASNHVHSAEYLKFTLNGSQGKGGTCFGDSGGPNLLGNSDTILSVNSYVTNGNCAGVGYSNRIDVGYALDFINSF
ncbi:MAG TPA: trypsin-like serine protease [Acidimicrobiia bacterium]|jgi:hypothetical protein